MLEPDAPSRAAADAVTAPPAGAVVARSPRLTRFHRDAPLALATLLIVLLAACAPVVRPTERQAAATPPRTTAPTAPTRPATPATPAAAAAAATEIPAAAAALPSGWAQEGLASWYGPNFVGRPTANGEIFDPSQLTAAHKELPFGTRVRVTDLATGRHVVVRINDRGPFKPGRVIDLSRAAAESIGLVGNGVAHVRVELAGGPGGLRPLRTDARLSGYDVIVPGLPVGSLLVLRGAAGAEVLVRTVALTPPATPGATGEDLWTSPVLAERLGTAATVVLD